MKIIVIAGLVAVVASLFSALYYLYHDRGHGTRMVKALALRVALSAALVVFLVVSYHLGWIAPTGSALTRCQAPLDEASQAGRVRRPCTPRQSQ